MQSHKHQSEHWEVVEGEAYVTIAGQSANICVNQSIYIKFGQKHRLENLTERELVIIEVQCGDYLDESDIFRYNDQYDRAQSCLVVVNNKMINKSIYLTLCKNYKRKL